MLHENYRPAPIQEQRDHEPFLPIEQLAHDLVFKTDDLSPELVKNAFIRERERGVLNPFHKTENSIEQALLGLSHHERADVFYGAVMSKLALLPKPELVTREYVLDQFLTTPEGKAYLENEAEALRLYKETLAADGEMVVRTSENTRYDAVVVRVSALDLRNRAAERILDATDRTRVQQQLDDELKAIIESLSDEEWGRALELKELFLFRRLIHKSDKGHLMQASHGTLREDLRQDMGLVDMRLFVAGDEYQFQIKTFKAGASRDKKAQQQEIIENSKQRLRGTNTNFAHLTTERVDDAYRRALRQGDVRHTKKDKYDALSPLMEGLSEQERKRILSLSGLTEEDLTMEHEKFLQAEKELNEHLQKLREKEKARIAAEKAELAALEAARLQAEDEERKKSEEIRLAQELREKQEREARQVAFEARQAALLREEKERAEAIEQRRKEVEAAAAAAIKADEIAGQKKAKAEKAGVTRKKNKENAKRLKQLRESLLKPDELVKEGFLAPENRNAVAEILKAKKLAEAYYAYSVLEEILAERQRPAAE